MRRVLSLLAVAAVAVTLAACGGGDKKESTTGTTVAVATTVETPPVYTGDPNSAFCAVARANIDRIRQIGASFVAGGTADLDNLLADAVPAVREAESLAPSAIKDDVQVLADGFQGLLDSSKSGQVDTSIALDPKFTKAAEHLTLYGRQVCQITG